MLPKFSRGSEVEYRLVVISTFVIPSAPDDGPFLSEGLAVFERCRQDSDSAVRFEGRSRRKGRKGLASPACLGPRIPLKPNSTIPSRNITSSYSSSFASTLFPSLFFFTSTMSSSSSSSSTGSSIPSAEEVKSEVVEASKQTLSSFRSLIAGGVGGICAVVVGHPFDLVKVRMQTADKGVYSGALDVVRKTVAREGLRKVGQSRDQR